MMLRTSSRVSLGVSLLECSRTVAWRRASAPSRSLHSLTPKITPTNTYSSLKSVPPIRKHRPTTSLIIATTALVSISLTYLFLSPSSPSLTFLDTAHADDATWPSNSTSTQGSGSGIIHEITHPSSRKVYASPSERTKLIKLFKTQLRPDQISQDDDVLKSHVTAGGTWHQSPKPDVVVFAESTEDVQLVLREANRVKCPVVPYNGGTSLEGHITAPYGGVCLDLSRMDKTLRLSVPDSDMTVQAGKEWMEINSDLEDMGIPLFFPLDPGPGARIGGMCSTGSSGTNAVRYGTARGETILSMKVVLADGKVIQTRSRARKSSAGFDLGKLFTGAEGTLGVITEVTIKLAPLLPTTVAICAFPSVKAAVECVGEVLNRGVPIQCVELCDSLLMKAFNANKETPIPLPEADSIFFKFQGSESARKEAQLVAAEVAKKHGGKEMIFAKDDEQAKELWHIRKSVHWSMLGLLEGNDVKMYSTDMCVPVSNLPILVSQIQGDLREAGVLGPLLGHVGDGNIHCGMVFHEKDFKKVDALAHKMVDRAIALDGTCTGEHGVGVGKKQYLRTELGPGTVEVMKSIKELFDPNGILNPGKLYPDDEDD